MCVVHLRTRRGRGLGPPPPLPDSRTPSGSRRGPLTPAAAGGKRPRRRRRPSGCCRLRPSPRGRALPLRPQTRSCRREAVLTLEWKRTPNPLTARNHPNARTGPRVHAPTEPDGGPVRTLRCSPHILLSLNEMSAGLKLFFCFSGLFFLVINVLMSMLITHHFLPRQTESQS